MFLGKAKKEKKMSEQNPQLWKIDDSEIDEMYKCISTFRDLGKGGKNGKKVLIGIGHLSRRANIVFFGCRKNRSPL